MPFENLPMLPLDAVILVISDSFMQLISLFKMCTLAVLSARRKNVGFQISSDTEAVELFFIVFFNENICNCSHLHKR